MAIDKSLPNKKVEIPGPQEQAEQQIEIQENLPDQGETEITPLEDGGVEINFEPGAFSQEQGESHFDNLAELLPEETLYENFKVILDRYNFCFKHYFIYRWSPVSSRNFYYKIKSCKHTS